MKSERKKAERKGMRLKERGVEERERKGKRENERAMKPITEPGVYGCVLC